MKFSFILCTRNSERVLAEVVESIASQKIDHKFIEIILADYESSDQTIEIVKVISKKYQIKFNYIKCHKPGKTSALEMALDFANGDYSVIVDDDTILDHNYVAEAEKLLTDPNWGCLGSQGTVDKNLILPDWFNEYKGHYAIGVPLGANDWVWGACCIVNMISWKKLRKKDFKMLLNGERVNHTHPVKFGGDDVELSLAICMIGYRVKFVEQLKFIHKFDQKRLNQKYFLENVFGTCKSIPILEIYRLIIYKSNLLFPKTFWILVLFKITISSVIRLMINILTNKFFRAKHKYAIILGIMSGFIYFGKNFHEIYNRLKKIKKLASNS
jgi:glycosyltransferase involved in cell wall biosynthesis